MLPLLAVGCLLGCGEELEVTAQGTIALMRSDDQAFHAGPLTVAFTTGDPVYAWRATSVHSIRVDEAGPVQTSFVTDPDEPLYVLAVYGEDEDGRCTSNEPWASERIKHQGVTVVHEFSLELALDSDHFDLCPTP